MLILSSLPIAPFVCLFTPKKDILLSNSSVIFRIAPVPSPQMTGKTTYRYSQSCEVRENRIENEAIKGQQKQENIKLRQKSVKFIPLLKHLLFLLNHNK